MRSAAGIAWAEGGTVGHITVTSNNVVGAFAGRAGCDAVLSCCMVAAGKYRNGAARSWCRAHQQYWGVKADLAAFAATGLQRCARHAEPMSYLLDPLLLDPAAYDSVTITFARQGIHLDARARTAGQSDLNTSVAAFALRCPPLFGARDIVQLNLTPPALQALSAARRSGQAMGCVDCARCGHPHLDLGRFATTEHRRHTCGNCGHDATHSAHAIISHPLFALERAHAGRLRLIDLNVHGHTVL
jgi:transposase-like protein